MSWTFNDPSCQIVDISLYWNTTENILQQIIFFFNQVQDFRATITIVDRQKALFKRFLKSGNIYDGAPMEIEDLSDPEWRENFVSISQTFYQENSDGVNCRNYPTDHFVNYSICDESFVYDEMKNVHQIMPFWAAKNNNEVTNKTYY